MKFTPGSSYPSRRAFLGKSKWQQHNKFILIRNDVNKFPVSKAPLGFTLSVFTARANSYSFHAHLSLPICGKVYMFLHMFVLPQGSIVPLQPCTSPGHTQPPAMHTLSSHTCPLPPKHTSPFSHTCLPFQAHTPIPLPSPRYGWEAGGTHPTGMLSCLFNILVTYVWSFILEKDLRLFSHQNLKKEVYQACKSFILWERNKNLQYLSVHTLAIY